MTDLDILTLSKEKNASILKKGEEILKRMEAQSKVSLFSKDYWYGSIMDWSMKNESFKTNMFRFVDVLPSLNSGQEVARHLKEYFSDQGGQLPPVFNVGLGLGSLAPSLMAGAIKKNVTSMAKMFITGENPEEAIPVLKKARKNGLTFTVDILGESTLSEKEALEYQSKYLELIDWLSKEASKWDHLPLLDEDHIGVIPKINVSVKMTALYSQINDKAWDSTKVKVKERLRPLFEMAIQKNVFLNLDMEHYGVKDLTLEIFKELLSEDAFRSYRFFGCVIQAYLKDSLQDVKSLVEFSKWRGVPFTVRLVKGAYWDFEVMEAQQKGWSIPVFTNKDETDANYEKCAQFILNEHKNLTLALASHNVRTLSSALVHAESLGLSPKCFEVQMLYGMAEPIKKTLVDMGLRVREYAPVGELLPGMAYLVRRLLENTSNESWLRGKFADGKSTQELLKDPSESIHSGSFFPQIKDLSKSRGFEFSNEPLLDFAIEKNRKSLEDSINKFSFGVEVKPCLSGVYQSTNDILKRPNPSHTSQIIADIHLSTEAHADRAVELAHKAFNQWKKIAAPKRASYLRNVAELMKKRRFNLITTQIMEVGKPWAEADADVAEAIDFLNYYAAHAERLDESIKVGGVPGEVSSYRYQPRGVCLVIAPWNFPLAILTGQVAAALVTGNTVVMKPAEQSSRVASELFSLFLEVGLPPEVLQFIPGLGEVVGARMVQNPLISTIAFTGSKAVGLYILQQSSLIHKNQNHIKRCIIEMGGKNALIIDNDADLDEAVDGVLYSAFGFAGQKCSAASRCIVLDEVYDRFVERLTSAADSILIGSSIDPNSYLGPVVDQEAYSRIMETISQAEKKHTLLFKGKVPDTGYFVPPTIFANVLSEDSLAQEEIFGPVLAIIRVKTIEEAIQVANNSIYALTGGYFGRSPANIERIKSEMECGNLYINRGITGAMVDRHPFGGFKMSGVGSKTGGPDYLKQFMEPICITENTLRRGFAPAEE